MLFISLAPHLHNARTVRQESFDEG